MSHADTGTSGTQTVRQTHVLLLPSIQGGLEGWCLATRPGQCEGARAFEGPIVAQSESGQGPPQHQIATVVTTSEVAAVSIDGGQAIPTQGDAILPDHLRTVVVEVQGGPSVRVPGFGIGPKPLQVIALNSKNEPIQWAVPRGSLLFVTPSRRWESPAKAPRGPCELHIEPMPGLMAERGLVVDRVEPHVGLRVRPILSCVSTSFSFKGSQLTAAVLLDATHPGTTPTSLPAMRPLAAHSGIFEALGGAIGGLADNGRILARRVPGAWLVVSGSESEAQRLALLEHLHATVHL